MSGRIGARRTSGSGALTESTVIALQETRGCAAVVMGSGAIASVVGREGQRRERLRLEA